MQDQIIKSEIILIKVLIKEISTKTNNLCDFELKFEQ
jgi:hypothetical protein